MIRALTREGACFGGRLVRRPVAGCRVAAFNGKYRYHDTSHGANPPQLAALAYDAVALVGLLSIRHALSLAFTTQAL